MRIKLNLRFLIAAFIVMMIYTSAAQAQANLTFSGGTNSPITITLLQSVQYTVNTQCGTTGFGPLFIFDGVGNLFAPTDDPGMGTMSFTVSNSATEQPIVTAGSGLNSASTTADDIYVYGNFQPLSIGNTVILKAGTFTTTAVFNVTLPQNGSYDTFLTAPGGTDRCSENGVALPGTTAASVSISGRVLTSNRRGLSNALVYLTDSEGTKRTARTNSLGYYRFNDIAAGQSVTVTVISKRYQFAPQILNLNEEMSGVNFLADN